MPVEVVLHIGDTLAFDGFGDDDSGLVLMGFGCGEGGDVFRFLQKTRGLSFTEAAKELGSACGINVEEKDQTPEQRKAMQEKVAKKRIKISLTY